MKLTVRVQGNLNKSTFERAMRILARLIEARIKQNVRQMDLMQDGGGFFLQGWNVDYQNGIIAIENTQPYAVFLEYGTYTYWQQYGQESYPATPDPKKKDIDPVLAKRFPKGMQPFAPVRRVIFNVAIMSDMIQRSFKAAKG